MNQLKLTNAAFTEMREIAQIEKMVAKLGTFTISVRHRQADKLPILNSVYYHQD